jgi:cytochrome c oxidase subunit III
VPFSVSNRRAEENQITGGGGRGALPPQPFGGGGGGGRGDGDPSEHPAERLRRYRMGLYFTVGSIVMLFVTFTTLFVARRHSGKFDPFSGTFVTDWISIQLPTGILLVNTCVLLLSSITAELARRAAALECVLVPATRIPGIAPYPEHSRTWLKATVVFGSIFLFGQAYAWHSIHRTNSLVRNPIAGSFVYMLTGAHAIHLFAGLVVLLYAVFGSRPRKYVDSRRIVTEVSGWYWHFMGVMWLYVLVVVLFLH